MATANERQIGGKHYGGTEYQHWDWVCDVGLHYLPAAASKYVYRWRGKNGVEDLQKALHYIEKAEERHIAGSCNPKRMTAFWRFVIVNKLGWPEALICWCLMEGEWQEAAANINALAGGV